MGILSWIVLGLVVGILAKWIMPGPDSGGMVMTILLGVAGAFVGGWLGTQLGFGSVLGLRLPEPRDRSGRGAAAALPEPEAAQPRRIAVGPTSPASPVAT